MKRNTGEAAPVTAQAAYKLKDVTYVPHYRNSSLYVGPGYPKFNRTPIPQPSWCLRAQRRYMRCCGPGVLTASSTK